VASKLTVADRQKFVRTLASSILAAEKSVLNGAAEHTRGWNHGYVAGLEKALRIIYDTDIDATNRIEDDVAETLELVREVAG
jgi:hypothetical protein